MWPQNIEAWLDYYRGGYVDFQGEDEREAYTRLRIYPPLRDVNNSPPAFDDAKGIALEAASQTRALARTFHSRFDDLFDRVQFGRWLRRTTWRLALRLVLRPERVERVLYSLPTDQRRVLQWRYLDGLDNDETATVLNLKAPGPSLWDAMAAEQFSIEAYQAFVVGLRQTFPIIQGLAQRDTASFFPLYLGGHL